MKATGPTVRRQHPGAHRRALAPVRGVHEHLVGAGGPRRVGGAVARPVVDHHDLELAVGQRRRPARRGGGRRWCPMRRARGRRARPPTAGSRAGRGRARDPRLDVGPHLLEQHRAVHPHPERGGHGQRRQLGQRPAGARRRGSISWRGDPTAPATSSAPPSDGGDHERDRRPDPPHRRVVGEGDGPVRRGTRRTRPRRSATASAASTGQPGGREPARRAGRRRPRWRPARWWRTGGGALGPDRRPPCAGSLRSEAGTPAVTERPASRGPIGRGHLDAPTGDPGGGRAAGPAAPARTHPTPVAASGGGPPHGGRLSAARLRPLGLGHRDGRAAGQEDEPSRCRAASGGSRGSRRSCGRSAGSRACRSAPPPSGWA